MTNASEQPAEYEHSDASAKLIAGLAAAVALFLVLSPLVLRLVYPGALQRSVVVAPIAEIPGPRLQAEPAQDLAALRRLEEQRLSSYGWIDRQQKTVHMPIDRAIAATVERGLTGWREK
jgi:hypothetical protein